jgi:hypothetical protein
MKEKSERMKEELDLITWLSEPPVAHRRPRCGGG